MPTGYTPVHDGSDLDAYPLPAYPNAMQGRQPDPIDRNRTPSPTPSEREALETNNLINWKKYKDLSYWKEGKHILVLVVIVILSTIFHTQIVNWLQPLARWMHDLPAGFLIPIAIFFVISFPPLFGHEILAVLCGLVWGLGPGFAIVAAGTLVGEWGNYFTFRFCCRARAKKIEKSKIAYAALAKAIRDGGFVFVVIARYSVIPGHLTTALFSTCGIGFLVFTAAAILSLPKQFITVYMGTILEQSQNGSTSSHSKLISALVIVVTTIVTMLAMRYMRPRIAKAKQEIVYTRRKARFVPSRWTCSSPLDLSICSQNRMSPSRNSEDTYVGEPSPKPGSDGFTVTVRPPSPVYHEEHPEAVLNMA
ncbi:hypothetical protein OE88DRAFT_501622 [Heliocybe sulcata]|uniref:Golgi apparatus membrane protein TVP38 n=1 Tax=Heliocybe sulcata TaxID=5364 RepID=A0A5C3MUN7_9AGAM|nr:hypothetical protein OE88DRAFT_501622 [Heliocybe sulcata]